MSKKKLLGALLGSTLVFAAAPAAAQGRARHQLNIPATSLDEALKAVSRQTGRDIIYPADLVEGLQTKPLSAKLSADDAVRRLLKGSALQAEFRAETVIIRGRGGPSGSVAGATPSGEIIVTGSRIRGDVTISTKVVARERAQAEGLNDLGELIRSLPQNFSGGQNPGVIGSQGDAENVNSSSALNLRGLGPDATLTLVNGHRVAYDAAAQGVDISAIPLIAVERLELLPDGSSALYGSDAVAGVANVILRSPFDGGEARARVAVPTSGGGVQDQYSLLAGTKWMSGGLLVAVDYLHADPINADQRRFTRSLDPSATILPGQTQYSGVIAGQYDVLETLSFTIDGQYSNRKARLAAPFLSPGDVRTDGALLNPRVETYSVAPGFTLTLPASWQAKLGGVHGVSRTRNNSVSFTAGQEFIRAFAAYRNRIDSVELGAEGPLVDLPGGAARLAVGGGWRRVELDGDIRNVISGVPRVPLDVLERYDVGFAYAEGALPLFGEANARPGLQVLRLNGAVRYEHYTGIGGVTVPKLSVRYDPVRALSLRASWGRSFKAPTLLQKGQLTNGFLLRASRFRPPPAGGGTVLVLGGGNSNLQPERARTWTAGVVFTPLADRDVRVEAVYYNIRYRDRVAEPIINLLTVLGDPIYNDFVSTPTVAEVNALVASLSNGFFNQSGAPFNPANVSTIVDNRLSNIAQFRVEGVDVSLRAATSPGRNGQFTFDGTLSYIRSNQQLNLGQPSIQRAGTIYDPPHWRGRAALGWQQGEFGATGVISHIGGTRDDVFTPGARVGGFSSIDLSASWTPSMRTGLLKGTMLTLAATNLLKEEPDIIAVSNPAIAPFDSTNYPSSGRVLSLTLAKRW